MVASGKGKAQVARELNISDHLIYSWCKKYGSDSSLHGNASSNQDEVTRLRKQLGAVIGGEGSGGVIYPDVHTGRDSLVAVALALNNLASSGMTLSQKKASLPHYEIVKSKIDLTSTQQVKEVLASVKEKMSAYTNRINEEDGLRFDLENSWLHVRASNTEPIIRLIAEAPTKELCHSLIANATK